MSSDITAAANALFDEMLREAVGKFAVSAHREMKRGRVVCGVCGTKCRSHNPLSTSIPRASSSQSALASSSRAPSPLPSTSSSSSASLEGRPRGYIVGPEKGTGGASGIGSGSGRMDPSGNSFFACIICDRQITSSRYAPHISGCLGFNGSTRRTASRATVAAAAASAKARLGSNAGSERGSSPYLMSEGGDSDDGSPGGSLGGKKAKMLANNGKRGISPKKPGPMKKARMGSNGTTSPLPRSTLPPSKLGRPPTTSQSAADAISVHTSPSPGPSVISVADSSGTGYTALSRPGGAGGVVGRKTLPGMNEPPPAVYVHDDDSDGDVDDY